MPFCCSSAKGHCSHGGQLYLCPRCECRWALNSSRILSSCRSELNHVLKEPLCLVSMSKATLLCRSKLTKINQIRHFKHQLERIKHLFTYRYRCQRFLSIKRTLQINMKHHTFIIMVSQNTFLPQPHCTTLDNENLEINRQVQCFQQSTIPGLVTPNTSPPQRRSAIPAARHQGPDRVQCILSTEMVVLDQQEVCLLLILLATCSGRLSNQGSC